MSAEQREAETAHEAEQEEAGLNQMYIGFLAV